MKLHELIEASEPTAELKSIKLCLPYVDRASYEKMRSIAVELAKACENSCDCVHNYDGFIISCNRCDALSTCRQMLGEK